MPYEIDKRLSMCPFCGADAALGIIKYADNDCITELNGQAEFHFVNCCWCGSNNRGLIGHKTEAAAIAHWNTRS